MIQVVLLILETERGASLGFEIGTYCFFCYLYLILEIVIRLYFFLYNFN